MTLVEPTTMLTDCLLGLVCLALSVSLLRSRQRISGATAGVLVSLAASAAQAGGFDMAANFNHNDLYHVVETGAVVLFHRAFVRSRDK